MARRQLRAIGLSDTMVTGRVRWGQLVRLHHGVYAVGHARLRREGWWMAAVLAAGPGALLSHRDAAALHGLLPPGDHGRVEVTTTGRAASTPRVEVHPTTVLDPLDATTRHGIRATSVARTLVDLAGTIAHGRLAKALEEAERRRCLDVAAIERALDRTAGRRGAGHARMREALEQLQAIGTGVTQSELEDRFLALLDAYDLPRPLTNHAIGGMVIDACWPEQRVAVELDGWAWHATRQAFQRDRERSNDLVEAGWSVLRFTWADVTRRADETVARVRGALRRGRRYPPTP